MILERLNKALPSLLKPLTEKTEWTALQLHGDASNRVYFRICLNSTTFIAMVLAQHEKNSLAEEITKTTKEITELPFIDVQRYLFRRNVRVPQIYGYDQKEGILLLEDFGDKHLLDYALKSNESDLARIYEKALDQLERICIVPEGESRQSIAFFRHFDRDLYNWEFQHFVEYAVEKRLKLSPNHSDKNKILKELFVLTEEYLEWDQVFSHRDYHSRNLLILNSDPMSEIGVIDFQDALIAPLFYDLASLLRDSYFVLTEKTQCYLIERYRQQMASYGFKLTTSQEAFHRAFDLMGLHRNLKAAGRFCYIDEVKKKSFYLKDVPHTLSYVKKTLTNYKELQPLSEYLYPYLDDISEACI